MEINDLRDSGRPTGPVFVGSGSYFCALGVPRAHPKPYEKPMSFNAFAVLGLQNFVMQRTCLSLPITLKTPKTQ